MIRITRTCLAFGLIFPLVISSCLDSGPQPPDFQEQLEKDIAAIDSYLATNNITAETHASGIRYVLHEPAGTGSTITVDSCVTTNYKGMLMATGVKFDENTNISFPLEGLIVGWQIGIPLLQEGDSATLFIPSGYGYGFQGFPPAIPSNANLIFGIKILKVGQTYASNGTKGSCD